MYANLNKKKNTIKKAISKKVGCFGKKNNSITKRSWRSSNNYKIIRKQVTTNKTRSIKIKQANFHSTNKLNRAKNELSDKKNKDFTYTNLIKQPSTFQYLCGLTLEQFDIILKCALPYVHLIPYPDCTGNINLRKTDSATELLSVLTTCRHGLHQGVMGYIFGKSKSTVQRIFIGWVIFLATLFNEIELKPPSGFSLQKMPHIFVETGHGLTDLDLIDAIVVETGQRP